MQNARLYFTSFSKVKSLNIFYILLKLSTHDVPQTSQIKQPTSAGADALGL